MKKILIKAAAASAMLAPFALALPAHADTLNVDFESPTYTTGSISGQDGWSNAVNPAYDQEVVSSPVIDGSQSFRISDAVTSGSFGDWVFTKSLGDEAGETAAQNSGLSGGTRQSHFEAQFDLQSVMPELQSGLHISISPDRGDGARMSYLRFEDQEDGIHVFFDDYKDNAPLGMSVGDENGCGTEDLFPETDIATLSRTEPHTIKFVMDFVDGRDNDVVKIYIDNALKATGTSWEGYFNYCEGNPTRTVDSLIIQSRTGSGPVTNPADDGKGFLIDNLTLSSSTPPPASCPVGTTQSVDPIETVTVNSALSANTSGPNVLSSGSQYLLVSSGTWTNSLNVADTEYASIDGWVTHMNGYDITPFFLGEGEFDLQINDAFVNWGSYDGANHTYSYLYTGTGAPVNLRVFDGDSNTGVANAGWYGDNNGSLSVDVYSCVPNEPPVCEEPAAPAIANAILKAAHIKNNSAVGKNIISQVAHEMNEGKFGENPCVEGYAEAVETFVQTLLTD